MRTSCMSSEISPAFPSLLDPMDHCSSLRTDALALGQHMADIFIPLRTLTWTLEYPFVTFLTLLMTFDMVASEPAQ
jgi:hypothetical protein